MNRREAGLALAALTFLRPGDAHAAAYPDHPIRLVVPYPPGASTDGTARIVAEKASAFLGQSIVVDNRGGASGNIGSDVVAKSPPDGYTFCIGTDATHAANVHLFQHLSFDPIRDFTPLSLIGMNPIVLVVNPSVPAQTVPELVAWVKANPARGGFGSSGQGSPHHLAGELLRLRSGAPFLHVPYRGGGPALTDVLGGQISMIFSSATTILPHVRAGRLRAIAVTSARRYSGMPDVPPIADTYAGFDIPSWLAFFAPAGLPPAVAKRLSGDLIQTMKDPAVKTKLMDGGLDVVASDPEQLAALQKSDSEFKGKLIRDAGIQPE